MFCHCAEALILNETEEALDPESLTIFLETRFPDRLLGPSEDVIGLTGALKRAGYETVSDVRELLDEGCDVGLVYEQDRFGPNRPLPACTLLRSIADITDMKFFAILNPNISDISTVHNQVFGYYLKLLKKGPFLVLLFLSIWLALTVTACAKTLNVSKIADANDGVCDSDCSLREALHTARDHDTIFFNSPEIQRNGVIRLSKGELIIDRKITIIGPAGLKIERNSTAPAARIFTVLPGGNLSLVNIIVTGGTASMGGGIFNEGIVTLFNVEVIGNSANATGGGIENRGTLNVTNSNISFNASTNNSSVARGGGIFNVGEMTLVNTTVSNNTASVGGGIDGGGTFRNVTVANNTARIEAGGINTQSIRLGNTILANNTAPNYPDCLGNIASDGYNLIKTLTSDISGTTVGNIIGADPRLDSRGMSFNGGATRTIALLLNSPAIDKGGQVAVNLSDQRGYSRPYNNPLIVDGPGGDGSDIGAFEVQQFALTVNGRAIGKAGLSAGNAIVILTNLDTGATRFTLTNPFGYYRFLNVPTGQTYTISLNHKRFVFVPESIVVQGDRTDIDFFAQP